MSIIKKAKIGHDDIERWDGTTANANFKRLTSTGRMAEYSKFGYGDYHFKNLYAENLDIGTIYNVKNYGAKGDGITDDTASIQATLNAAGAAGGGLVYIPRGTYIVHPILSAIYLAVYNNIVVEGDGYSSIIKVQNNNGHYTTIFGSGESCLTNVIFRGFAVDHNIANNSDYVPNPADSTTFQGTILLSDFNNINIEYLDIITAGGQTFGGWYNDVGNTASKYRIANCNIEFQRPTGSSLYDSSSIIIYGFDIIVTDNIFKGTPGISGCGYTAIETHGPRQVISNNIIYGYLTAIISCSKNRGTVEPQSITISDNSVTNCRQGIQLWPIAYDGTDYNLDNVSIVNNSMYFSQATDYDGYSSGVQITGWDANATAKTHNLLISGNTMMWDDADSDLGANIEYMSGILITAGGDVTGLTITNNMILNNPTSGICIHPLGIDVTVENVLIEGNIIVDAGQNANAANGLQYRGAMLFITNVAGFGRRIKDCTVINNKIIDTGAMDIRGYYSICLWNPSDGFTRFRWRNNTIYTISGNSLHRGIDNLTYMTGATPSLDIMVDYFVLDNVAATKITGFTNGYEGETIRIYATNGLNTYAFGVTEHNAPISSILYGNGGINYRQWVPEIIEFTEADGKWYGKITSSTSKYINNLIPENQTTYDVSPGAATRWRTYNSVPTTITDFTTPDSSSQTSGTLVEGEVYTIAVYVSNDDFTNVGAPWNGTGVQFTATGTTPTHWVHSSLLYKMDKGNVGSKIIILFYDGVTYGYPTYTTIDFTSGNIRGNGGVNWNPCSGDWMEGLYDGTYWLFACHRVSPHSVGTIL